jgi:hypothetical protein
LAVARSLEIRVVISDVVQVSGVHFTDEPDSTLRQMWSNAIPYVSPEVVLEGYARYSSALQAISAHLSAPFISTAEFGLRGLAFFAEGDPIHFNDRGADRMGREMARVLLGAGALDQAPVRLGRRAQKVSLR